MNPVKELSDLDRCVADATLGIDTLWGGDVMHHSGEGRFVADSWFSGVPLPLAYTHPTAARLRQTRGIQAKSPDREAIEAYLGRDRRARRHPGDRRQSHDAACPEKEVSEGPGQKPRRDVGPGDGDSRQRRSRIPMNAVSGQSTGCDPQPSNPSAKRKQVRELLDRAGYPSSGSTELHAAVDAWRGERMIPRSSIPALSSAFIAEFDQLAQKNLLPYLPKALHPVPRVEYPLLPDHRLLFLRIDELCGPGPQRGRKSGI